MGIVDESKTGTQFVNSVKYVIINIGPVETGSDKLNIRILTSGL